MAQNGVFATVNGLLSPLIKLGFAGPCPVLAPAGLVVLETIGRRTGRRFEVPVVALRAGDYLAVGSVRRGSQWLRNLDAQPRIPVWLNGRRVESYRESLSASPPTAIPRRLATAARLLFGPRYEGRVLRVSEAGQVTSATGDTITPLASA